MESDLEAAQGKIKQNMPNYKARLNPTSHKTAKLTAAPDQQSVKTIRRRPPTNLIGAQTQMKTNPTIPTPIKTSDLLI